MNWAAYVEWLHQVAAQQRGHVPVSRSCWPCEHGSCPPLQAQAPVKAVADIMVSGQYASENAQICFYDMVPVCVVCYMLHRFDPDWNRWIQDQYADWKSKGAA